MEARPLGLVWLCLSSVNVRQPGLWVLVVWFAAALSIAGVLVILEFVLARLQKLLLVPCRNSWVLFCFLNLLTSYFISNWSGCVSSRLKLVSLVSVSKTFQFVDRLGYEWVWKSLLRGQSLFSLPLDAFLHEFNFNALLTSIKSTKSGSMLLRRFVRFFPFGVLSFPLLFGTRMGW